MSDIAATTDHRPAILICAWNADERAWDPIEAQSGEPWSPSGARTVPVAGGDPEALASTLSGHLRDRSCRALLLVGRGRRGEGFRLQMRAENRTPDGAARAPGQGPCLARATAPVAEIVRALNAAGLDADASSEVEEDAGDYLLYQVLSSLPEDMDTPAIGLLRAGRNTPDAAVQRAVRTVAEAMTCRLAPLPRARAV